MGGPHVHKMFTNQKLLLYGSVGKRDSAPWLDILNEIFKNKSKWSNHRSTIDKYMHTCMHNYTCYEDVRASSCMHFFVHVYVHASLFIFSLCSRINWQLIYSKACITIHVVMKMYVLDHACTSLYKSKAELAYDVVISNVWIDWTYQFKLIDSLLAVHWKFPGNMWHEDWVGCWWVCFSFIYCLLHETLCVEVHLNDIDWTLFSFPTHYTIFYPCKDILSACY